MRTVNNVNAAATKAVYFDNAATSYPKPPSVRTVVSEAVDKYGGNPGRGGHSYSINAAKIVFETRSTAAQMFGASVENVVFTLNCTHALNYAIKGVLKPGDRMVISSMEHNSVARPSYALSKRGVRVDVATIGRTDEETLKSFSSLITSSTKCVVCTAASNVTGRIMPIREIAQLCRKRGVCFIVDAAQAAGIIPISLADGMNFICTAGHKGLYGTTGTGLLISDGKFTPSTIIEGGTGATSAELNQTGFMPELLESGTVNTVGIASLNAGMKFVKQTGLESIYNHEDALCELLLERISPIDEVTVYRRGDKFVPIVSFNVEGIPADALASALSDKGYALRGGLHCAPLAHKTIRTLSDGTVRFSPSVFSSEKDVKELAELIKKFAKHGL